VVVRYIVTGPESMSSYVRQWLSDML